MKSGRLLLADAFAGLGVALLFFGAGGHFVDMLTLEETYGCLLIALVFNIAGVICGGIRR